MDLPRDVEQASGFFFGRDRERRELAGALAEARQRRGKLFLLAGEPGIGKTALAQQLGRDAAELDVQVAWGRCWESGGAPPYWSWVQVIRHCLRNIDSSLPAARPDIVRDLAQLVPELRPDGDTDASVEAISPEQARFRLFDSVVHFLRIATSEHPLLVVLDDIHWADEPSLLLLHFVARELRGLPILLIGTYREGEVRLDRTAGGLLASIGREGRTLALSGLSNDEVDRLISARIHRPKNDDVVARIQHITEGNPLFVEEMVHLLQTPDGQGGDALPVPESVRDVIRRRLEGVPGPARDVLTSAAVLGREFDRAVVERMRGGLAADELAFAVDAGVVVPVAGAAERYRFSHALVTETLYADMPPSSRVALHQAAATALLSFWGSAIDEHLDEVAHHFLSAANGGELETAVDWAVRAGDHAMKRLAFETAATSFARALDTMRSAVPLAADEARVWMRRRVELLICLAGARNRAGDASSVNDALLEAIARARSLEDPHLFATAVLALGATRVDRGNADDELVTLLQEAIRALGPGADATRARLMARLASSFYLLGADQERTEISLQAVELARRSGDDGALASALTARHSVCWQGESSQERLTLATEIVRLAETAGEPEAALEGLWWRVFDLLELGDIPAADAAIALYEKRANELRLPTQRWYASVFRTTQALVRGRFSEAERLAAGGLAIRQMDGSPPSQFYAAQMFAIRRKQGRLAEIEPALRAFTLHYPGLLVWQCVIALIHIELGDLEAARQQFDRLAARRFEDFRQDVNWLPSLAMLAEVSSALGDEPRAVLLYDLLQPCAGRNVVVVGAINCLGSVEYFLGLLAATIRQWDTATRHLGAACNAHDRLQAWPLVAQAQFELARVLLKQSPDRRARALTLMDQARATARNLGMRPLEHTIETELASLWSSGSGTFRREGDHWVARFEDTVVRLKNNRGCLYIAYLLARPGRQVPAEELLSAAGATASSEEQARVAVRKAITGVLRALAGHHDALRQHLAERIQTGKLCSYATGESAQVKWEVSE